MTDSHVEDTKDLTPEQLQLEIARTKSAIAADLRVLSERFSPEHLREGAREVMRDAREEATHLLHSAKGVAIDSIVGAKERAIESVHERVNALGNQTRDAANHTLRFVSDNRVALSAVTLCAGFLYYVLRGLRAGSLTLPSLSSAPRLPGARVDHGEPAYRFEHYSYPLDEPPLQPRPEPSADASSPFATRRSERRGREPARDNRGAVVAVTVLAGLGLGLLLPVGRRPRRAIARAGERVWDEAQAAARTGVAQAKDGYARARDALQQHSHA